MVVFEGVCASGRLAERGGFSLVGFLFACLRVSSVAATQLVSQNINTRPAFPPVRVVAGHSVSLSDTLLISITG